ncbi:hypothetical protein [Bifidobacterium crudilactis]|uniref:hypothetical protein n=1 Tax=Bifidobacterium crudilactis TaxID=327277 RepID=UPI002648F067|nr:hypothetical protein [Bifidobacterium crudilactis]MDN5971841.1 hypothetical protein [Bifidobacterium crudilactis]MDN6001139.1 hypothetical protein [Bifidobacterium crudilactis]MDN6466685.1 hypothetical protein [Bifidobacterium crudilactis]MDN6558102.1 hypothetical protein [Bifidobacterium crudilactis]MDN6773456.1 hypothetical protein [Bifidobacterium crudilactis]
MSIAKDEAERRYPIEYSNFDCDVSKLSACRRAFALGAEWQSQREPTEAEIEAAAKRIFIFLNGPWEGKHCELSQADGLAIAEAARETADKQKYEACAEFALQSARKAVTGDERGY